MRLKSQPVMKKTGSIFNYQDYRSYLRAVIDERKLSRRNYSRKSFAKSIGFASESGLNMILTEKRELRSPYLDKCIKNLELNTSERIYFEAMIRAGKLTPTKRRQLLKDVECLSGRWEPPSTTDGVRLIDLFIVQQILCLTKSYMSVAKIQRLFRYSISEADILEVLEWMEDRNFVVKSETSDSYKILRSILMAKDEITDASLRSMHHDAFRLASYALENDTIEDREFQTYMFTVNRKSLPEMKDKIKKMVLRIISDYETESTADSVMQMHFHLAEAIDQKELAILRGNDEEIRH